MLRARWRSWPQRNSAINANAHRAKASWMLWRTLQVADINVVEVRIWWARV
jgi:hypothetical protein